MKLFQWLKSLFTKESKPMTEPVTTEQPAVAEPVATPATEVTEGVKDLAKAYEFIKSGISHLGEAAEGELLALAKKYL
ncbi:hypothetical protein [Rosenbergiella epipactidis]|uniref:hypothetical protein n=1 Tax=Rosenbergiella epipactidis TaxID=1544694 RepID=UPI001F500F87|nr:hypothetical protein [Rosenbergiella epipactidis]